jgi:NADPH-dependent 2,4-dienoyl-CoA reductase/sulfur reductase-like enzyme
MLRAHGFDACITIVGAEDEPPYERPALSKSLLAGIRDENQVLLRKPSFWAEREIDLALSTRVAAVDVAKRIASSESGRTFTWNALVLATGATARPLAGQMPEGVHTLRSLSDALALRDELAPGVRLVVVGAGFVGTEVASTALALGVDVVLVEASGGPLERVLGREVSSLLAQRYRSYGIDLRLESRLSHFLTDSSGHLRAVALTGGVLLACDVAVVALGAVPKSPAIVGLTKGGAVETDACGRTAVPGVYACGDVASAWRPALGLTVRVEHWTNAAGQATAVAHAILGDDVPHDELPYFWSDQFGLRLQHVGHAERWASAEIDGGLDSFSVTYRGADGVPLAALLANRTDEIGAVRQLLTDARLAA